MALLLPFPQQLISLVVTLTPVRLVTLGRTHENVSVSEAASRRQLPVAAVLRGGEGSSIGVSLSKCVCSSKAHLWEEGRDAEEFSHLLGSAFTYGWMV